jgi:tRNA1Val (adenine37-N6)-methyltransferase
VLLADFVRAKPGRAVELCSGAGLISLLLLTREPRLSLDCVELDPAASAAAERNFAKNGLGESARALCLDIRAHRAALPHAAYGLAVCNPPYFAEGSGRASESMAVARSEAGCTLAEVVAAAAWCLRTGGAFCLVHRPERLAELLSLMGGAGLEPKRLRLVQHRLEKPPSLVLVEGRKGARPGLEVQPALILTGPDGQDSAEVRRIYHREEN